MNGKAVGIPSTFADFVLRLNGRYSELVTPYGLIVALSPDWRSYVQLPRTFSYYTKGFCGNYDDVDTNDFVTSGNTLAIGYTANKIIGDSYVESDDA